jgi:hypothetical protein
MADIDGSNNDAFSVGVNHLVNPGRANVGSITLNGSARMADQGLDQTAQRWDSLTPHGVLRTVLASRSSADTAMSVEFGQEAAGNRDDAEQAGQSMNRMLMQRAADIGTDDGAV